MAAPEIETVIRVGFGFAPKGWCECDGRQLSAAEHPVPAGLLGTTA